MATDFGPLRRVLRRVLQITVASQLMERFSLRFFSVKFRTRLGFAAWLKVLEVESLKPKHF